MTVSNMSGNYHNRCIQVAVRHYRVSQSQMVEIWLKGKSLLAVEKKEGVVLISK